MRIKTIETFTRDQGTGIVRIRTDDGAEGIGQMAPSNADISVIVLHRQIAPLALGADPTDIDGLVDRCMEGTYKFPGSYCRRALSGLDTALWDLRGKLEGKGVCELIGGQPRALRVYGSSMRRDTTPDQEADRLDRLRQAHGLAAFKLKIGKRNGHDQDEWPGRTESVLATVRRRLGSDVQLLVDANSCYSPARAIEVGHMLEGFDVSHFEEPCPYWRYEWTAQVAATLDVPVAGGEQDCFLTQWRRMLDMRAVDIAQPDVCYVGGFTRARRVAAMADQRAMSCMPHSPSQSLVIVFTMHLLAAIPNAGSYMEFSIDARTPAQPLYSPMPEVRDGKVAVPEGPGWGVKVNPDWLGAADYTISEAD